MRKEELKRMAQVSLKMSTKIDVSKEEKQQIVDYINDKYPDFDLDIRDGKQPVYSFLIGVE